MHSLDVCRPSVELGRVDGRDSACEYVAVRPDELDAVARPEAALPAVTPTASRLAPASTTAARAPASTAIRPATRLP